MAAEIRSSIPAKPTLDSVSRDDLALAEVVTVEQKPPVVGTTWAWTLVYVPEGSAAVLTPPAAVTTSGPMDFTVDRVGSYLVRLVVDAGLPTESTQYVRLRALTASLGLKLVAAGERRDATGVIPVDVDTEGWANEQNFNLLALETAAATDPLADVLVVGNITGGTDILMTTGDRIVGQTHVVVASTGAGTNIVLNPDATGSVVVNGKLTVTGLIDPTGVIFDEAASPTVVGTKGGLFVSDGSGALTQNHLYYQPTGAGVPVDLSHAHAAESLADTLVAGNTTGATDLVVSAGQQIQGQTKIILDEGPDVAGAANKGALFVSDGSGAYVANELYFQPTVGVAVNLSHAHAANTLSAVLAAGNTTGGTNIQITAGDSIIDQTRIVLNEAASPTVVATEGGLFVSDGTGGLEQNEPYYKNDAGNDRRILHVPAGDPAYLIPYNINMPDVPNDTVQYQGWVPTACVLQAVRAMMVTLNTQGNYTLAVTNVASGNTCLSTATFDMNGLVAGGVTDVALTGTPADLAFSAPGGATAGRWNVSLVSDDAAFDGSDIYIELVFGVP